MTDIQPSIPLETPRHSPASVLFIVAIAMVALIVQVAIYWPTTNALPFGDDWGVPLSEINRGDAVGPLSFFTETRQPDSYRPVQSLLMWLFGRVDEAHRWFSIRLLHFICSGALVASLALMLHPWRIGRSGVVAAMLIGVMHPTLVAPVGSVDGFSSTLSCAFVWIGVWAMVVFRNRLWLAVALACVALVLGTLVKEYAFALAPMGVLTALVFFEKRWRSAVLSAAALGALTFLLLWVRQFVKPADMELPPSDFEIDSVMTLAKNAGLVVVGGLFFGDSFGLYLDRSLFMKLVSALVGLLAAIYLIGGWWRAGKDDAENRWRMLFLVLSFAAVTFPANAVMRISEMYLCGLVVSVALMFAVAADGWSRKRDSSLAAAWLILLALCVTSGFAIRHKMAGTLEMGELAKVQADGLVRIVSASPNAKRVKILYREDQLQPREKRTFSSYRLADCYLIRPTAAWVLFPGRDLTIDCVPPLPDERAVRAEPLDDADMVLYWDVAAQRYERLK